MGRSRFARLLIRGGTSRAFSILHRTLTRDAAAIFMLHRFANPEHSVRGHDPNELRTLLAWLRRRDFPVVSLEELVRRRREGAPLEGCVCFTVDDGYADFARVGMDAFAEFDCPVTVFLPSGFLDGEYWMWWDRIQYMVERTDAAYVSLPLLGEGSDGARWPLETAGERERVRLRAVEKIKGQARRNREASVARLADALAVELPSEPPSPRFRPLTWDEVRRCERGGATFGPHTRNHVWLAAASDDEAKAEVRCSWDRVREETRRPVPVFCYPYGTADSFGRRDERLVRDAGLEGAVTTVHKMVAGSRNSAEKRLFRLPRYAFADDVLEARQICTGLVRLRE